VGGCDGGGSEGAILNPGRHSGGASKTSKPGNGGGGGGEGGNSRVPPPPGSSLRGRPGMTAWFNIPRLAPLLAVRTRSRGTARDLAQQAARNPLSLACAEPRTLISRSLRSPPTPPQERDQSLVQRFPFPRHAQGELAANSSLISITPQPPPTQTVPRQTRWPPSQRGGTARLDGGLWAECQKPKNHTHPRKRQCYCATGMPGCEAEAWPAPAHSGISSP